MYLHYPGKIISRRNKRTGILPGIKKLNLSNTKNRSQYQSGGCKDQQRSREYRLCFLFAKKSSTEEVKKLIEKLEEDRGNHKIDEH